MLCSPLNKIGEFQKAFTELFSESKIPWKEIGNELKSLADGQEEITVSYEDKVRKKNTN